MKTCPTCRGAGQTLKDCSCNRGEQQCTYSRTDKGFLNKWIFYCNGGRLLKCCGELRYANPSADSDQGACPGCNGRGWVKCSTCKGKGEYTSACSQCGGKGSLAEESKAKGGCGFLILIIIVIAIAWAVMMHH